MSTGIFVGEDVKQKASYTRAEFAQWLDFLDEVAHCLSAERGRRTRWVYKKMLEIENFNPAPFFRLNSELSYAIYDLVKLRHHNVVRLPDRRYDHLYDAPATFVIGRDNGWKLTPKT